MKRQCCGMIGIILAGAIGLAGCSGSNETTEQQNPSAPSPTVKSVPPPVKQPAAERLDTLDVTVKNVQRPPSEPLPTKTSTVVQPLPAGKFGVQVGAYKVAEGAERIASIARDRFGKKVFTAPDATTGLIKVFVGEFATKDEARQFRDQMARQYPGDYNDAWVSEIAPK